jgi:hypothetical protein
LLLRCGYTLPQVEQQTAVSIETAVTNVMFSTRYLIAENRDGRRELARRQEALKPVFVLG